MLESCISVLIAEDSETIGRALVTILNSDPETEVTGWAKNGVECLKMAALLKPDIVTMDINMPVMDGIETTRKLLKNHPVPILIVSSLIRDDLTKNFEALRAGAFDVIERPGLSNEKRDIELRNTLIYKVKKIAKKFIYLSPAYPSHKNKTISLPETRTPFISGWEKLLVIGASTGGPSALYYILSALPKTLPCPVMIVQHMAEGFVYGLVNWLQANSGLTIKVAEHGERLKKGVVYFPPDNYFMGVAESCKIFLESFRGDQAEMYSINFLMESAASVFHNNCIGILLTGMGSDGANGMKLIKDRGGKTLAQDEKSSLIFGMPKEAIKRNGVDEISPLDELPYRILNLSETPALHNNL